MPVRASLEARLCVVPTAGAATGCEITLGAQDAVRHPTRAVADAVPGAIPGLRGARVREGEQDSHDRESEGKNEEVFRGILLSVIAVGVMSRRGW